MTQVIQHDYGKSKVSLLQIRAAIKAVKEEKLKSSPILKKKTPSSNLPPVKTSKHK